MKNVTIFGAGLVSRPLVKYLYGKPEIKLTIATKFLSDAVKLVKGLNQIKIVPLDVNQEEKLIDILRQTDVAVSLLPAFVHPKVAKACLQTRTHLITASYVSDEMRALDADARSKGLLFLNEMGLDPGIDHMVAMKIINKIKLEGGKIISFQSICGGLPSKEANNNPFGYKFSWSPRSALLASNNPATYLRNGEIIHVKKEHLFRHKKIVRIEPLGEFEVYPNRDSLHYKKLYQLNDVRNLFRGTIRNIGWGDTIDALKKIGFLDDTVKPELRNKNFAELLAMLVNHGDANRVLENTAKFLSVDENSEIIKKFRWLELFSNKKPKVEQYSYLNILTEQMSKKLRFARGEQDMVILQIQAEAELPDKDIREIKYSLIDFGESGKDSAMARTVSLPIGSAVNLLLQNKIGKTGVQIPVHPEIYIPVLDELEKLGINFIKQIKIKPYALL